MVPFQPRLRLRQHTQPDAQTQPDSGGLNRPLAAALDAARERAGLPAHYPEQAVREAEESISTAPWPPEDLTEVPFVTIDPEGSRDLDQALWIDEEGDGWLVQYAIADVPRLVPLGGALDAETRQRGETAYLPQGRIPLHPAVVSEDAGSLLPGEDRAAYVWRIHVDTGGASRLVDLRRARVRSREQLTYTEAQRRLQAGDPLMGRLHAVGEARRADERRRGGANLRIPEQEVTHAADGSLALQIRTPDPIEEDNAQISLLTGITAGALMLQHGVGLLRTMPEPDEEAVRRFRAVAAALGHPWQQGQPYGRYLDSLDVADPRQLAIMHQAGSLFRGAAYTVLGADQPQVLTQAAVGAPYAHTTAPLRRLVDRFVLVVCHALANQLQVPAGVQQALPLLPDAMRAAAARVGAAERESLDIVEASLLSSRTGQVFDAVVVDASASGVRVVLTDLAIVARATGEAQPGDAVRVRVEAADVEAGTISLSIVP